jgi:HPt (histidine-containing phosphotransfer) domain-containing protein
MSDFHSKPVDPCQLRDLLEQFGPKPVADDANTRKSGESSDGVIQSNLNDTSRAHVWNDEILDKLIVNFLDDIPGTISVLELAMSNEDNAAFQSTGHRLRGAAEIIGFSRISLMAHALEDAGANGNTDRAVELSNKLVNELERLALVLSESPPAD